MKFHTIFKAGKYPQGTFTDEDIEQLAKNYDPKFCEAPITLDHEQSGPAYGWIQELKAENGELKAVFRDVSGELKELVLTGKYKKVSVEIYKDLEGRGLYLKAVTFLGAGIPQVKGMEPVQFKEGESEKYVFEVENTEEPDKTDPAIPADEFTTLREIIKLQNHISELESRLTIMNEQSKDDKQVVSLQDEVQRLSSKMKIFEKSESARQKAEHELSELKLEIKKKEFEQFLSEQEKAGMLLPVQKELSLKLFAALDNVKQFTDCSQRLQGGLSPTGMPFSASNQASETDYVEEFKKLLKTLPKQVELKEIATKAKQTVQEDEPEEFENADEESLAIYREVKLLSAKENIPFRDAVLKFYQN